MSTMNLPTRALSVARFVRSLGMAEGDRHAAAAYASSQNWADAGRVVQQLKGAVGGIEGGASGLAGPVALDLAEVLRPMTILGRLPGVRRMPFNSRLVGLSAGAAAAWVRPGGSIPLSGVTFSAESDLTRRMVAALLVVSEETLRDSNPVTERTLNADLFAALAQAMDRAFVDPSETGDADTPASVTSSGYSTICSGTDVVSVDADLGLLVEALLDTGSTLATAAWVLHSRTAAYLARLRGSSGAPAYPGLGVLGGTLLGLPVLVSAGVPVTDDSGETTSISLIDGDGVLVADQDEAELTVSRAATLELDASPTADSATPTAASATRVGLFQVDAAAVKAVRFVNWLPRRATVAATLTGVPY